MMCERWLKLAKANRAAMGIANRMASVAPMRSPMGNARKLDAKASRHAMANAVPKVIVRVKANAVTVIAGRRDVPANGLPKAIVARTATVRHKAKAVEARCLGSLNCSIETKMDGSAAMNSTV